MPQLPHADDRRELLKSALVRIGQLEKELAAAQERKHEPIAIVGLGCRFPAGANTPEAFWDLLSSGVDCVREVPADRWPVQDYYDADPDVPGKTYSRCGGFLDQVDGFDPAFFGISPREAALMDPQQRLLLEVAWEALEHAGISPASMKGTQTGVFVGFTAADFSHIVAREGTDSIGDAYIGSGVAASVAAGRLSYTLGLQGPCITVDTACSSSLVATHLACQSLLNRECNVALAGGVSLILTPDGHILASKGRMLSPDGRCYTFDARANGYVRSEGCGIIVLKRLSDARADGDTVLAVIRGSAVNQDGRSSGLTAPNGRAQEDVMRRALQAADLSPENIGYVEAHGTGTSLGDPIEVEALGALHKSRPAARPLLIGSVKSNVGHLEAAAGVAGLIKMVLAIQHRELPPHLHFQNPNTHISWDNFPVKVAAQRMPWPSDYGTMLAGVSSFGFSGTNAHVILEEHNGPEQGTVPQPRRLAVLPLSARNDAALRATAAGYARLLRRQDAPALQDVCFTASVARSHHDLRLAIAAGDAQTMAARLEAFAADPGSAQNNALIRRAVRPVFVFGGQGSQYPEIARELFDSEPVFRNTLLQCDEILRPLLPDRLLEILYPAKLSNSAAEELLQRTEFAQPVLFAVEYALAQLWRSWGVEPAAVIGHSVGEYVAACVAGVFGMEEGLRLIAKRGRLMQELPRGGAMISVMAEADRVAALIQKSESVSIAAINGPASVVISGNQEEVRSYARQLEAEGVATRALSVSHAFHSPLIAPVLAALERVASEVRMSAPQLELISNLTGRAYDPFQPVDVRYWARHARETVRFAEGIETLRGSGHSLFLEIAPTASLSRMGRSSATADANELWLPSLRKESAALSTMLESVAALYERGVEMAWPAFYQDRGARKIQLPTYAFQRTVFELPKGQPSPAPGVRGVHPLLGSRLRSPRVSDVVFQAELNETYPAFLKDHRIGGHTILPASAYLEMAAAAATQMWGNSGYQVRDLSIREPLKFDEGARLVQVLVAPGEEPTFEICSSELSAENDPSWVVHAQGTLRRGHAAGQPEIVRHPTPAQQDPGAYYNTLRQAGAEYGPTFRLLTKVQSGQGNATATIPGDLVADRAFLLHPAILDTAFQLVGVALSTLPGAAGTLYMPVQVEAYHLLRRPQGALDVYTSVRDGHQPAHSFRCDVTLTDAEGEVARIEGLTFARAHTRPAASPSAAVNDSLLTMAWQTVEAPSEERVADGLWLLFDQDAPWAAELGHSIGGDRVLHVRFGESYRAPAGNIATISPDNPEDLLRLLAHVETRLPVAGMIHLWNLADPAPATCGGLLAVVQGILQGTHQTNPRLTVVTRGAQAVTREELHIAVEQAASWGLVRTLNAEESALPVTIVDLDPQESIERQIDQLTRHARSAEPVERHVALRAGRVYAPRLVRNGDSGPSRRLPAPETEDYALDIASRGVLDQLHLAPLVPEAPQPGEVQIEIEVSGMNFRDVLNALGMYSGKLGPLGNECVGTISQVGAGVTGYACGDRVMALTPRAFCSRVNTAADLVWHVPANMSMLQAATIPLVFQTAYYALVHVAGLKRGDRVLIHAAAGGVGLAAVQIAQSMGAEVFATAGSPAKRAFLAEMGVTHVMNSRTLDFAEQIHQATGGQGVHVVLNSLAGSFIPKSLDLLTDGGVFLELGSSEILSAETVSLQWPKVRYQPVFLGNVCVTDPGKIRSIYRELLQQFEAGTLKPLPHIVFPIDRAHDAFRFMAQARHLGKILIASRVNSQPTSFRADATYLISGGFGALGLHTARWMAAQGARRIVLTGRRAPSAEAAEVISELRAGGVEIIAMQADVSNREELAALLQDSCPESAPLRGIIHAAGTLQDALIRQQTPQRFTDVFGSKAVGAMHLDTLTREADLDFFILYSAGAAVLGSPGQSNYASANAVLDALAADRRAAGLPATSINWGPWAGGGMASRVSQRDRDRWASRGIRMIDAALGMGALEQILTANPVQAAVLPLDWKAISQVPPILLAAAPCASQPQTTPERTLDLQAQVSAADPDDRAEVIRAFVRQELASVLGFQTIQRRDDNRGFTELGLDSLTAVELSNRLGRAVGHKLPATITFERPTVIALAEYLASRIEISHAAADVIANDEAIDEELDELSAEELEWALEEELNKAGY